MRRSKRFSAPSTERTYTAREVIEAFEKEAKVITNKLREEFERCLTDNGETGDPIFDKLSGFSHGTTVTLAMVMEQYDKAVKNL